jgi:hypothetical protein
LKNDLLKKDYNYKTLTIMSEQKGELVENVLLLLLLLFSNTVFDFIELPYSVILIQVIRSSLLKIKQRVWK